MGTDIHLTVEYKKYNWSREVSERWVASRSIIYDDRNYNAFAVLGNVRNGFGFAGVVTGEEIAYISDNRGIPHDATKYAIKRLSHQHSATWVTLAELLSYDWEAPRVTFGVVDAQEYAKFKSDGVPSGWAGGVSGLSVRNVSNETMEDCIARGDTEHVYTRVSWTRPVKDCVGRFYTGFIPALQWLCASKCNDNAERVRLVMDFDS